MQLLSTAFLIIALAIVVKESGATQDDKSDQVAEEAKTKAVTIVDGPKYVSPPRNPQIPPSQPQNLLIQPQTLPSQPKTPPSQPQTPSNHPKTNNTLKPEQRPPSKPPINTAPDKQKFYPFPPNYHGPVQKLPPRHIYTNKPIKIQHNGVYKYTNVISVPHGNHYYTKPPRPLVYAASTGKPIISQSPKFSMPVQTINGIRADFVKPPKLANTTTTTTTVPTTTTQRLLRTKRIWPKRILDKMNATALNTTVAVNNTTKNSSNNSTDQEISASNYKVRLVYTENPVSSTLQPTTRGYRRVTRAPKIKSTTETPQTPIFEKIGANDWVPIVPSHYTKLQRTRQKPTRISRRSDLFSNDDPGESNKQLMYLQSYGLLPLSDPSQASGISRKKMVFFRKRKRQLNPYQFTSPGLGSKFQRSPSGFGFGDLQPEGSGHPKVVTKVKHHHHHHHHRYIKTVEKQVKVPYKVEVAKPYPVEKKVAVAVPVEKIKVVDRPVPVPVEKRVPYPVHVQVPQPVPVKVVEKEYVPKPYPIIHHVPVVKHVEVKVPHPVPVPVERKVPYPVQVQVPVPVDRPVPVPVEVEKRVPYPVPVKVLVPQPYPVETKVPYPVEVKVREPYEVVRHIPIKVPYPQPYPVKVPHPVPIRVEKRVPYPIEIEKKVPVPVEVLVPHKIHVEKKVPIYVPKPYPVEKKVPYPIKVPVPYTVPVKVPVRVPVEVPVYIHSPSPYPLEDHEGNRDEDEGVTHYPHHSVTIHGHGHDQRYGGFQSRSDNSETTTAVSTATAAAVTVTTAQQ